MEFMEIFQGKPLFLIMFLVGVGMIIYGLVLLPSMFVHMSGPDPCLPISMYCDELDKYHAFEEAKRRRKKQRRQKIIKWFFGWMKRDDRQH